MKLSKNLEVKCDEITNNICSFKLYGKELLDTDNPSPSEFYVNGLPLQLRKYADPYGGDLEEYKICADKIYNALLKVAEKI